MNYRHAFHAGNFADVVKHAVLARILLHLRSKPAAFRVIDTHAGSGRYDLAGPEASRTREWRDGIGRVAAARLAPAHLTPEHLAPEHLAPEHLAPEHLAPNVAELMAPYLDVVARLNGGGQLSAYPGSCEIARSHLRPQDRLVACELEPNAARALARNLAGDARVKVVAIDGWTALTAYVPPKERRGLVLIDPAFEQPDEFTRLGERFAAAHRKWPGGTYMLWYPIKTRGEPDAFAHRLAQRSIEKLLQVELMVTAPAGERLAGCGLVIANPPWTLERELALLLPALAEVLARDGMAASRIHWLNGEK